MPLRINDIQRCIQIGSKFSDKASMLILSLLAPSKEKYPYLWRRGLRKLMPNIWIKPITLNGIKLSINPLDWSQTVIFEEVFLRNGYDLAKVGFIPDIIIDCGAHIGMFTLTAKAHFPSAKIIAFEPNPKNLLYLSRHVKINKLDIEIVKAAVSIKAGKISFSGTNSNSGRLNHESSRMDGSEVDVINFPEFVQALNLKSLLLKMDIEGEESKVLPEIVALLPYQTAIFFETHTGESGWNDISNLLVSNGFLVEKINSRGIYFDGYACRS